MTNIKNAIIFLLFFTCEAFCHSQSIKLDIRKCAPATIEQVAALINAHQSPLWKERRNDIDACPLLNKKDELVLYVVGIDINKNADAPPSELIKTGIVDLQNRYLGDLDNVVPEVSPWGEDVTFSSWRNGFPHRIDIHSYNPGPEGERIIPSSLWDDRTQQFEIPIFDWYSELYTIPGMEDFESLHSKNFITYYSASFGKGSDYQKWLNLLPLAQDRRYWRKFETNATSIELFYIPDSALRHSQRPPSSVITFRFDGDSEPYNESAGRIILARIPANLPQDPSSNLDLVLTQWRSDWPERVDLFARPSHKFLGSMAWNWQTKQFDYQPPTIVNGQPVTPSSVEVLAANGKHND